MGLFQRLFGKSEEKEIPINTVDKGETEQIEKEWEKLPAFILVNEEDYSLVSLIATAIAAGDRPESKFVVKKIMQRNPEVLHVSLIASSLAAADVIDSKFKIKTVYRKTN